MATMQHGVYIVTHTDSLRGGLVDTNGELVVRSFDAPVEMTPEEFEKIPLEDCIVQERCEGTIIRLVKRGDGSLWLSTHNVADLDTHPANWGARGFRKAFDAYVLPSIRQEDLETGLIYIILLQDTENRLVRCPYNGGIHLATLEKDNGVFRRVERDIGLRKPRNMTEQEALDYLEQYPDRPGVVVLSSDPEDLSTVNVVPEEYRSLLRVRNNEPHLLKRAMQLIHEGDHDTFHRLVALFPEYEDFLLRNLMADFARLADLYNRRYVAVGRRTQYISAAKPVHNFMLALHRQHGVNKDLTCGDVEEALTNMPIFEARRIVTA